MRRIWAVTVWTAIALAPCALRAQASGTPYPSMAPVDQYLMPDRATEIALARSAAPSAISRDAKILVLGRRGYETAVEGTNGFVCYVERSWLASFGHREFWNPKIRSPVCLNPPAARSILLMDAKRTELVLAGLSTEEIKDRLTVAFAKKELPAVEPGAMSYMMSKDGYLTDDGDHDLAHLMVYTPVMKADTWGADLPYSPVMLGAVGNAAEPFTLFIIPVAHWSDGVAVASQK